MPSSFPRAVLATVLLAAFSAVNLQALVDETQKYVTGTVRLKLYKGNVITCGRKSKYSIYDMNIASMEGVKSWYNQTDATGFIRLNGLRLRARTLAQGGPKV